MKIGTGVRTEEEVSLDMVLTGRESYLYVRPEDSVRVPLSPRSSPDVSSSVFLRGSRKR